jgi:3-oxoacyl-[acyl-carrier protein] reductase
LQAIAVGGDRIALWSHPTEQHEHIRPGGWSSAAIADLFAGPLSDKLQDFEQATR